MSFISNIPLHHKQLMLSYSSVSADLFDVNLAIERQQYGEEYFDHDCDCDYCDIKDTRPAKQMTDEELAQAKKKSKYLSAQATEIRKTIKGLEGYAKLVGEPLPEKDLLK